MRLFICATLLFLALSGCSDKDTDPNVPPVVDGDKEFTLQIGTVTDKITVADPKDLEREKVKAETLVNLSGN